MNVHRTGTDVIKISQLVSTLQDLFTANAPMRIMLGMENPALVITEF